jgi:hypothetical protein
MLPLSVEIVSEDSMVCRSPSNSVLGSDQVADEGRISTHDHHLMYTWIRLRRLVDTRSSIQDASTEKARSGLIEEIVNPLATNVSYHLCGPVKIKSGG